MPIIDTNAMPAVEKRPGWTGRIFASPSMTFAHWAFAAGATIHEHHHVQEEVWHILEGELEVAIGDEPPVRAGPGVVAVIPAQTPHRVLALTDGRAIVVDHPLREGF
ncbi:cupin domain-containing protein [Caulobacter sp. KR2-114]|uniref:cupin domain-containing protein n=1 Tax=Caulobacter sp. KR2-114 TaxID=3400912 RepID=UPI003C0BB7E0